MRGVTVYLLPARAYTQWFVALATANAAGLLKTPPSIDGRLRSSLLLNAQTDGAGAFRFDGVVPGQYYVFAVVNQRFGPPVISERVERGWDGRGHGADVAVPAVDIATAHLDQWVYAYGYDISNVPPPWHLGIVRPARQLRDGRAVTMP
jgi:protocatechuate 3,4-dioxygenase beta subunit